MKVGYSDFIKLFRVETPEDFISGLVVKADGVWVVPPEGNISLSPAERAALSEHPESDLTKPVLSFPCTIKELKGFVEWSESHGCIDAFDMFKFVSEHKATSKFIEKDNPKVTDGLLKMVIAMAIKGYSYKPGERSETVKEIMNDIESVGLELSENTIRQRLKEATEILPQKDMP